MEEKYTSNSGRFEISLPRLATSAKKEPTDIESRLHPFSSLITPAEGARGRSRRQQMYLIHIHICAARLAVIVTVIIVMAEPVRRNSCGRNVRGERG